MYDRDTDRELLEKAAKAAGIKIIFEPSGQARNVTGMHPSMNLFAAPPWNPLTDDGDALRLAVKIGLSNPLCVAILDGRTNAYEFEAPNHAVEPHEADPYAATRRAIVRAAAAMAD